ncbi:TAT-variant-translocated molybdopterin oxidoreductase [Nafulsella turpanensis]|uniref:TAT-variant-translocated molybdopterin oxidoreductase n=1 Tax=Nafulsella turpanensis TaxID=1265690 RepID=UPI000344AF69|nr:TAT-variant-translocated molybdopterin oxidoreductase [Nafulsella turpanensis]
MKENKKRYWKGLEQLANDPEFIKKNQNEFADYLPINSNKGNGGEGGPNRRDFLKMMGFGLAAASLAACEAPVKYAIPYLNKPIDVDPSLVNYYASTYAMEGGFCSIVVRNREGRPIKIEGNNFSNITRGGTSAQVEASVLDLYDNSRFRGPLISGEPAEWPEVDKGVMAGLERARNVKVVSNTVYSPSTKAAIEEFASRYNAEHIMYDAHSSYALIKAHEDTFSVPAIPSYDFTKADVIVSFGADFLGTWISPVEFNKQYAKTRKLGPEKRVMSRHYQFESVLTITGANADYRTPIRPSQEAEAVAALYKMIVQRDAGTAAAEFKYLEKAAKDLLKNRGRGLVVSSSNHIVVQRLVNAINVALDNYGRGKAVDITRPAFYRQGNDRQMTQFVAQAVAGEVDAVVFMDCNPVYDFAGGEALGEALRAGKIKTSVSTAMKMDETAALCTYIAPQHYYLEAWNDYEPRKNNFYVAQPTIRPLFLTRQVQESLLLWAGLPTVNYYDFMRARWKEAFFPLQTEIADFDLFWDAVLYTGVFIPGVPLDLDPKADLRYETAATVEDETGALTPIFSADTDADLAAVPRAVNVAPGQHELVIYEKVGIGTGRHAGNPWLQELPDPISRVTWDNYLTIPMALAKELGLEMEYNETKKVKLTVGDQTVVLPAVIQPGQAVGTVGIAMGYGRSNVGVVADKIGINAYPFIRIEEGVLKYFVPEGVKIEATDEHYALAQTQTHDTYMGRATVIQEATLQEYQQDPKAGRFEPMIATSEGPIAPDKLSLWDGHLYPNHHWAMVIDLNSCTGCNACVISCQTENNIPVVGRQEVLNRREMHWIRIDRYYSAKTEAEMNEMELNMLEDKQLELASANPDVVFQPMLCQHCNNAPCETVCPVAATTHSSEGLNMMTYNRCVGTRYCANNCPYKVRRFNWFKYHDNAEFADVNPAMNYDLGKMVLNPDVTVRARGVMEKCTFCVQRIQEGKLEAKRENRRPKDGEIITACAKACPADAIVFGDINNPDSQIVRLLKAEEQGRAYNVLTEIGTRPNIFYLTKIRNVDLDLEGEEVVTA